MSGQATGIQVDLVKARAYIGDDVMVVELMTMTCAMVRREWQGLEAKLEEGDLQGFKTGLHKWNGSLCMFVVDSLVDALVRLEQMAREVDVDRVRSAWGEIRPRLLEALDGMRAFIKPFGEEAA